MSLKYKKHLMSLKYKKHLMSLKYKKTFNVFIQRNTKKPETSFLDGVQNLLMLSGWYM